MADDQTPVDSWAPRAGPPFVTWDVIVSVPDARMTIINQHVEWIVDPVGVEPAQYARERLMVLVAGADPVHGRTWLEGLRPGSRIVCTVRRRETVLAEVDAVVPDRPALREVER